MLLGEKEGGISCSVSNRQNLLDLAKDNQDFLMIKDKNQSENIFDSPQVYWKVQTSKVDRSNLKTPWWMRT